MPIYLLPDRALLEVRGADAAGFLQGLITQDVTTIGGGRWHWAALLSPQGKLLFDFLLRKSADFFVLDVEAVRRAEFARKLNLYKLRAAVTIVTQDAQVVAGWDMPQAEGAAADARHPALGWRGTGDAAVDDGSYRAHRWHLGIAEGAAELGIDRLLWLEANAAELGGVSFSKGCYVGQENTARMHHRSKLRKRIMIFQSIGVGETVMAANRAAGDVLQQDGTQGVALMRLEHIDAPLALGDAAATLLLPDWLALAPESA
jgi:folate-binding protein YgfZ